VKGNKMAINLLRRWVENRERMITNNYTPDQMRTNLHTLAREHVSRVMGNDWQSLSRNRYYNQSGYAMSETKRMYKRVGMDLAQAIKDED